MKTSRITVIGLLICLSSIFYHDVYWLGAAYFERLPELSRFGFPIGVITVLLGLFTDRIEHIGGIEEFYNESDSNGISKIICPNCNKKHDIDYPHCPYCKYKT